MKIRDVFKFVLNNFKLITNTFTLSMLGTSDIVYLESILKKRPAYSMFKVKEEDS